MAELICLRFRSIKLIQHAAVSMPYHLTTQSVSVTRDCYCGVVVVCPFNWNRQSQLPHQPQTVNHMWPINSRQLFYLHSKSMINKLYSMCTNSIKYESILPQVGQLQTILVRILLHRSFAVNSCKKYN